MNECLRCGAAGMRGITHVCMTAGALPPPGEPLKVTLDAMLWGQIVFRVNEGDDLYLRQLVEQAVAGGHSHV